MHCCAPAASNRGRRPPEPLRAAQGRLRHPSRVASRLERDRLPPGALAVLVLPARDSEGRRLICAQGGEDVSRLQACRRRKAPHKCARRGAVGRAQVGGGGVRASHTGGGARARPVRRSDVPSSPGPARASARTGKFFRPRAVHREEPCSIHGDPRTSGV